LQYINENDKLPLSTLLTFYPARLQISRPERQGLAVSHQDRSRRDRQTPPPTCSNHHFKSIMRRPERRATAGPRAIFTLRVANNVTATGEIIYYPARSII
jgi:hypothetical protein